MPNRVEVSFQIVMGSASPGGFRTGTLAELYAHFFAGRAAAGRSR